MQGSHVCPIEGCTVRLPRRLLLCRSHWWSVPAEIRQEVLTSWGLGDHQARYLAARRAAIAAAEAEEERRRASDENAREQSEEGE